MEGPGRVTGQGLHPLAEAARCARRPLRGPGDAAAAAGGEGRCARGQGNARRGAGQAAGDPARGGSAGPGRSRQRTRAVHRPAGPGGGPGVRGLCRAARVLQLPIAPRRANPRPKGAKAWSGGRVEDRAIGLYPCFSPGGRMLRLDRRSSAVGEWTVAHAFVRFPEVVVVLAGAPQGRPFFVRPYRAALDQRILELPAGRIEPGEAPAAAAAREPEEETGWPPRGTALQLVAGPRVQRRADLGVCRGGIGAEGHPLRPRAKTSGRCRCPRGSGRMLCAPGGCGTAGRSSACWPCGRACACRRRPNPRPPAA